jgi:hypothetical protein
MSTNLLASGAAVAGGSKMFLNAVVSTSVYPAVLFQFAFGLARSATRRVSRMIGCLTTSYPTLLEPHLGPPSRSPVFVYPDPGCTPRNAYSIPSFHPRSTCTQLSRTIGVVKGKKRTFKSAPALTVYVPTTKQFANSSVTIRPLTCVGSGWPGSVVVTERGLCLDRIAVPAITRTVNAINALNAQIIAYNRSFSPIWTSRSTGTALSAPGLSVRCSPEVKRSR